MFDDEYPTCVETRATLRIYPGDIDPSAISERMGLEPTNWQRRGEVAQWFDGPPRVAPINGWFLQSEAYVESRDSRRHLDWILDRVEPKAEAIRFLQERGCEMDISCTWISRSGHGGPTVSPSQMKRLSELNLELWFDFYTYDEDSDA